MRAPGHILGMLGDIRRERDRERNVQQTKIDPVDLLLILMDWAERSYSGDKDAAIELRHAGELLAFVGGFEAMAKAQGLVHDYEVKHRPTACSLAGMIGACWESIPVWASASSSSTSNFPGEKP